MQQKTTAIVFAATFALLLLAPILVRIASTQIDATDSLIVSASTSPTRIHAGDNTTITVEIRNATPSRTYAFEINVTHPAGVYSAQNITVTANSTGLGSNATQYWGAFPGANTTSTGIYYVAIRNATTKDLLTAASFTVEVWQCQLLATDLASIPVSGLTIDAYNRTSVPAQFMNPKRVTNDTGWASFMLASGNYTFEAFWKQVQVGSLPLTKVENDTILEKDSWVQLSNLRIAAKDEATSEPLPFIQLKLEYNYTTESDENLTDTSYFETNFTGTIHIKNLFVNNSYVVEANRYGTPDLSLPPIHNETSPLPWHNITITFPVYTAFVHVTDSTYNAIEGIHVEAREWSGGSIHEETTDSNGDATFSLTLGRYRLRLYDGTILLNETLVDLTHNQSSFSILLFNYNIDLTVRVVDYFKQPIPNAIVKIERKADETYELTAPSGLTDSDGRATFSGIQGGDLRISIYISQRLSETQDLHLTDSERVTFAIDRYAVVLGYPLETNQLATAIFVAAVCVTFILALTHKRLLRIFARSR